MNKEEKQKLRAKMIREMGKVKEKENFNPKKLKNDGKPKGHEVNTINHHAPSGHVACGAATTHLIRSETPRVMDKLRKTFHFLWSS